MTIIRLIHWRLRFRNIAIALFEKGDREKFDRCAKILRKLDWQLREVNDKVGRIYHNP